MENKQQINLIIQEIEAAGYCTGCDHRANDPILPPHLGCCPDSNYVVSLSLVKKLISQINEQSYYEEYVKNKISNDEMPLSFEEWKI